MYNTKTPEARRTPPACRPASGAARREMAYEPRPEATWKLWLLSALRVDLNDFSLPDPLPSFDAVVVAGGVRPGLAAAVTWLGRALDGRHGDRPAVLVPGLVEVSDGLPLIEVLHEAARVGRELGVHVLSDGALRLGPADGQGLHIIGATLWPDLAVPGLGTRSQARRHARHRWAEIRPITSTPGQPFQPHDVAGAHATSLAFVEDALAAVAACETGRGGARPVLGGIRGGDRAAVVTAYAPTRACLPPALSRPLLDPWAAAWQGSSLDALFERSDAPSLWAFGHAPFACDFRLGRSRIVANPRGAPASGYDPGKVITV